MFYREIAPPPHLNQFILSYWEFLGPSLPESVEMHEIFPDGCVSLFHYTNSNTGVARLGVTPLQIETSVRAVAAGDRYWGMRISPAACCAVLGVDPVVMRVDRYFAADEFPVLTQGISEAFGNVSSLEDAIPIFESRMDLIAGSGLKPDREVAHTVNLIIARSGDVRIEDLARSVGLGARQLQRRFKAASGLTMKRFARIRRIREAAFALIEQEAVNWADRAAEMGYADQAHLTHEFSSVTKQTPQKFARRIKKIMHGPMVK